MRKKIQRESRPAELTLAIGLVWGHLQCCQYEEAWQLAQGCLRVWPHEHRLVLMAAYASVELLVPLDGAALEALDTAACTEWAGRIKRRLSATAENTSVDATPEWDAPTVP